MATDRAKVFADLSAPFPPADLEWRPGSTNADKSSALMLPYITGRAVMDRLDAVLGFGNWSCTYRSREGSKNTGWICRLTLHLDEGESVYNEDGADESDIEPTKGAISDALKRAAVRFGVGRYLYFLPKVWANGAPGRSKGWYPVKGWVPQLPAWALPGGAGRPPSGSGSAAGEVPESGDDHVPAQAAPAAAPRAQPPKEPTNRPAPENVRPAPAGAPAPVGNLAELEVLKQANALVRIPFDFSQMVGGKGTWGSYPWGHIAIGCLRGEDQKGGRRNWCVWVVHESNLDRDSLLYKRANATLTWADDVRKRRGDKKAAPPAEPHMDEDDGSASGTFADDPRPADAETY